MVHLNQYEGFVSNLFKRKDKNKEISFSSSQVDILYSLGFTNDDYYDNLVFHYKPLLEEDDIKDIRVSRYVKSESTSKHDLTWMHSHTLPESYEIQITKKDGSKIKKEFNNIEQNYILFNEFIDFIKSYIPDIDNDIKKYNI